MLIEVLQLVINGLMAGTLLALPAIGLTVIYAVLRFPNFALASHATIGAFAGYLGNVWLGLSIIPSLCIAFVAAGLVGMVSDEFVLKPFRGSGFITTAIGSIALTVALENLVRMAFGNDLREYDLPIRRDWRFTGLHVGPQEIENLAIAVIVMAAIFAFFSFTRGGKAMRAVADNPSLATIKGIRAERIARQVTFVGMGLAGLGGMLIGLDTTIDPLIGFRVILSVFAAAVVGGLGSVPGAVLGALTVGVSEELSLLVLTPNYRSVVGFAAILLVLILRPSGLLGQRGQ